MLFLLSVFLYFHELSSLVLLLHTAEVASEVLLVCSLSVLLWLKLPVIFLSSFSWSREPNLYSWENRRSFEGHAEKYWAFCVVTAKQVGAAWFSHVLDFKHIKNLDMINNNNNGQSRDLFFHDHLLLMQKILVILKMPHNADFQGPFFKALWGVKNNLHSKFHLWTF